MHLAERGGGEWLGVEAFEHRLRRAAETGRELRARQRGMHAGGFHLQLRRLGEHFFRHGLGMEAQRLTELHHRTAQPLQLVADPPARAGVDRAPTRVARLLVEEEPLQQVADVTARHAGGEAGQPEGAGDAAGRVVAHRYRCRISEAPSFSDRSRNASVCSLPGDVSCSQNSRTPR